MMLVRRNNYSNWLNDWFDNCFFNTEEVPQTRTTTAPAINVKETCDEYIMEVAVPGLKRSGFASTLPTRACSTWPLRTRWSTRRKTESVIAGKKDTNATCAASSPMATMSKATLCLTTWSATKSRQALPMVSLLSSSRRLLRSRKLR